MPSYSEPETATSLRFHLVSASLNASAPAGCLDMAGNVWEWTRSLWGENDRAPRFKYPYTANDDREDLAAAETVLRVLRGGAFLKYHGGVRCAYRLRGYPNGRSWVIGCR